MNRALLLFCVCTACGAPSSGTTAPNASANLMTLPPSDQNALCDWIAQQFGGYHSNGVCLDAAGGGLQGPVGMSGCIDQLKNYMRCAATVGQLQACIQDEVRDACMGSANPGASSSNCTALNTTCGKPVPVPEAGGD